MSSTDKSFIPVYSTFLMGNESKYVNECLTSGWISSKGQFISRFEKEFSKFIGVRSSTSVSNGTVGLHLALKVLGVGPGDEVIVPTLTYIATVNAILYVGAQPVFVDSDERTWNLDPKLVEKKINKKTKAILMVHLYGAPCDVKALAKLARENEIFLIEDAAEAFGSKQDGRYIGTLGDISVFSFFGNKTITTGEGGMLVANNESLIDRATHLKSQAVSPTIEYWHEEIGFNYRMTNLCAAIGLAQLELAYLILDKKRMLAAWYREELHDLPCTFQEEISGDLHSYWMVSILLRSEFERDNMREHLRLNGVETRPIFYPVSSMPVCASVELFPVANKISKCGMNLPSYPALTRDQIGYICSKIREALKGI